MREMPVLPTAAHPPTEFTSFTATATAPHLPVRLYMYIYLSPTSELYILSCCIALLIVDGRSDCCHSLEPDVALGLITYDMRLVSTYICLMS